MTTDRHLVTTAPRTDILSSTPVKRPASAATRAGIRAEMMKFLTASVTFLLFALPARGAKQVTVAELEQAVAADSKLSDDKLADELSDLELSQRLSATSLARIQPAMPGPKSAQEQSILAAQSSFLDLPPAEIESYPAPNVSEQRRIMRLVVDYVTQAIHRFPNFLATRKTRSFEDRPTGTYSHLPPSHQPIHWLRSLSRRERS